MTNEEITARAKILDSKKVKEYLDGGITIEQIYELDLAIKVTMDLPEHRLIYG